MKKQTVCLLSTEGWLWMKLYDSFSEEMRKRVRESPYNLCCACLVQDFRGDIDKLEHTIAALRIEEEDAECVEVY